MASASTPSAASPVARPSASRVSRSSLRLVALSSTISVVIGTGLGDRRALRVAVLRSVGRQEPLHGRPGGPGEAFRTNAVTELGVEMVRHVDFQLLPGVLGIADFFAVRANGEQTGELFGVRERLSQIPVRGFQLGCPLADVELQGITTP